jgi:hypothetical protein
MQTEDVGGETLSVLDAAVPYDWIGLYARRYAWVRLHPGGVGVDGMTPEEFDEEVDRMMDRMGDV